MKARNGREKEVIALYTKNKERLSDAQVKWVESSVVRKRIFTSGKRCWCSECGHSWNDREVAGQEVAVCPHCGALAGVEKSRKTTYSDFAYFQIFKTTHGWQVIRYVLVRWDCKKGREQNLYLSDVFQKWCQPGRPTITMGAQIRMYAWYGKIPYSLWSPALTVKPNRNYFYTEWMECSTYPVISLLPVYEKNLGKRPDFSVIDAPTLIGDIFGCPYLEQLWKQGRNEELNTMLRHVYNLNKYWPSVKIALRHGYKPVDWLSYFEYLKALRFLHYDMRSPRYVAPKDWVEIHDLVMRQYKNKVDYMARRRAEAEAVRRALAEEERLRKQEEDAKKCVKSFAKHIAPFLGLRIEDSDIIITPLTSIEAFREEGDAMHHCVFRMGYYKKKESLILSARTKADNERCETIELDIRDWHIRQSLGFADVPTQRHDKILSLVNNAIPQIKQMITA